MAMIESALAELLPEATGFPWFGNVPDERPARFGTFERTGGGIESGVVDRPMVALQTWAPTKAEAEAMADATARAVRGLAGRGGIRHAAVESAFSFPDDKGRCGRYQVVARFACVNK